jgi:hypothetical protein
MRLTSFFANDQADSFRWEVVRIPLATSIDESGAELSFFIIPPAWKIGKAGASFLWHTTYI